MKADRAVNNALLASDIRVSVGRLRRRLVAQRGDETAPSLGAMAVLGALGRHGPMTVGELAAYEQVRPPSMTRTVTALERAAWVRRVPDAHDGRVTWVELTDHGRDLVAADQQARDAWLARQLRALEPEEREVLRRAAPILAMLSRHD